MALSPGSVVRSTLGLASLVGREAGALLRETTAAVAHDLDRTGPGSGRGRGAGGAGSDRSGGADQGGAAAAVVATDPTDRTDPADRGRRVGDPIDAVHLWWGVLAAGGDRAGRAAARLRGPIGVATDLGTWVLDAPPLAPATRRVRAGVRDLVERGRAEEAASREAAGALAEQVLWRVVRSETVDRVVLDVVHRALGPALDDLAGRPEELAVLVQAIVGDVIGPVLDLALPVAFERIAADPALMAPLLEAVLPVAFAEISSSPELMAPLLDAVLPVAFERLAADPALMAPLLEAVLPVAFGEISSSPELMAPLLEAVLPVAMAGIAGHPEELGPVLDGALPVALDQIAGRPDLLVPVLDAVVDRALEPMLRDVLPQVFAVLADDPEPIRALVRDQSSGVAAEMAGNLRLQAARADDRLERAVRRLLRRRLDDVEPQAGGSEPPRALPPAGR